MPPIQYETILTRLKVLASHPMMEAIQPFLDQYCRLIVVLQQRKKRIEVCMYASAYLMLSTKIIQTFIFLMWHWMYFVTLSFFSFCRYFSIKVAIVIWISVKLFSKYPCDLLKAICAFLVHTYIHSRSVCWNVYRFNNGYIKYVSLYLCAHKFCFSKFC